MTIMCTYCDGPLNGTKTVSAVADETLWQCTCGGVSGVTVHMLDCSIDVEARPVTPPPDKAPALTPEMIRARPYPWVGMPYWSTGTRVWGTLGVANVGYASRSWSSGNTWLALLPGEPGCPPLPMDMQVKPGGEYVSFEGGRGWWQGARSCDADYGDAIPCPDDYVLRPVGEASAETAESAPDPEQDTSTGGGCYSTEIDIRYDLALARRLKVRELLYESDPTAGVFTESDDPAHTAGSAPANPCPRCSEALTAPAHEGTASCAKCGWPGLRPVAEASAEPAPRLRPPSMRRAWMRDSSENISAAILSLHKAFLCLPDGDETARELFCAAEEAILACEHHIERKGEIR